MDGALTVSADRAVPVVAAVTERLGLPSIGSETAHAMTHKIAMRRRFADLGVPQPDFASVRTVREGKEAIERVGLPAVLKPADSGGQRGIFYLATEDDLEAHLWAALRESPAEEAIVESFHDGDEAAVASHLATSCWSCRRSPRSWDGRSPAGALIAGLPPACDTT